MGRSRDLECFLRGKLFQHLQTLSPKYYNNKKTDYLMASAINDLGAIGQAFADISDRVQENISGIRVVKAYAQEDEVF